MLVLKDIVEIKRGKGTFVKSDEVDNFTLSDLKGHSSDLADLLEMRLIIEPMGAYYATKRASDSEIEKIIEYGEMVEQKILNNEDRTIAEQLFHNAIAKASGNSFMKELVPIISKAINESVQLSKQYEKATELTLKDHKLIMDFMKDRNAYINLLELYFSTEKLLYIISNEKGTKPREETVLDCGYAKPLSKMFFDRCQEMNEEEIETLKYLNDKEFINKIKVLQETRNFGINFSNVDDGSKMDINTIEFRMPNCTINPDVLIENINLFGGNIKVANELSIIQSKDILSKEEGRKIQIFNKIKDSNTSEKEKLEYLLILAIPEENREIYINRYIVNKELLKQDEERNYELNKAAELKYGKLPELKKQLEIVRTLISLLPIRK